MLKSPFYEYFFDRNDVKSFIFLLILMIVASSFELLTVISIGPLIELLLSENEALEVFGDNTLTRPNYLVLFIILLGISATCTMLTMKRLAKFSANFGMNLSDRIFTAYIKNNRASILLAKSFVLKQVTAETQRFTGQIIIPALQAFSKLFTVVFLVALLLVLNFYLTIALFIVILTLYGLLIRVIGPKITRNGFDESDASEQRLRVFNSFLDAKIYSFLYVDDIEIKNSLANHSNKYSQSQSSNLFLTQIPRFTIETFIFLGMPLIIYLAEPSSSEAGEISIYLFSFLKMLPGLQQIYYSYVAFKANRASLDFLCDPRIMREDNGCEHPIFSSQLQLFEVKYDGLSSEVKDGISFNLHKGQKILLNGPSGCGKSSLLKVIMGLRTETQGHIKFDGQVSDSNSRLNYARNNVAYLEQFPVFHDASLLETMRIKSQSDFDVANSLMQNLNLTSALGKYINKPEHEINFEKLNLSGGELQRLAFCRALMSDAEIFLLDEPFSALDQASINKVFGMITKSCKTFIIVSHIEVENSDDFLKLDFTTHRN
jgi:ABC-type multidrug transport system fused ATPase/permease subunit